MRANERIRIWVHPDFKKKLFREAIDKNTNVIELTKKLCGQQNENDENKKRKYPSIL